LISLNCKSKMGTTARLTTLALAALAALSAGVTRADDQVPVPWNGIDIGGPSPAGSSKADGGVFTLTGGGGTLGGDNDRFHFVYQSLTGDCALVARVSTGANAGDKTGGGIMARQALESGSDFVALTLTPGQGVVSTYRTLYAPHTASQSMDAAFPVWVKMVKRGTMVQSYSAADQSGAPGAWQQIGGGQPIPSGMIYVGLCQASGAQGGTVTFDHVSLVTGPQLLFDDGVYTITPASALNMVLVPAGNNVKLAAAADAASQKWRLTHKNGFYTLQPLASPSFALSVPNAKTDNGSPLAVSADQGQNTQRWSIISNNNGTYSLRPQFNSNICLDDFGGNGTPDATIDIWNYNGTDPHLQWIINSTH